MAKTKVDNKLNVVIGTKSQIESDPTIPENSILIVTDEKEQALNVEYDNTISVLEAYNVQDAIDIIIELLGSKLDKNFSSLIEQTVVNLTDVLVVNRGNTLYKTTVASVLANVANTEIFKVVSYLPDYPEPGDTNKIFLVPTSNPEMPNYYEEWIWVDYLAGWEKLGGVTVDLSNYYNKNQTDTLLSYKQDKLTAGENITIVDNVISAIVGVDLTPDEVTILKNESNVIRVSEELKIDGGYL